MARKSNKGNEVMFVGAEPNKNEGKYSTVMDNLKPFGYIGKSKTPVLCSATIPLDVCYVDGRYQGLRQHKKINRLISRWDIRKLTPIVVVPHPEESRFAIVDGYGRACVAAMKKMKSLQAIVLMDAPENYDERLKFEAEYFIGQDAEVENVKPLEKHLARCILGDPAALAMDKLLKKYGVKFVNSQGRREESVLGSYPDTYRIVQTHGEKCLDFCFSVIQEAGWNKESNGYATFVMRPLKEVWAAHPQERDKIKKFLAENLRQVSPQLFTSSARIAYPKRDQKTACVLHMEDIVCNGLHLTKKIYYDNQAMRGKIVNL